MNKISVAMAVKKAIVLLDYGKAFEYGFFIETLEDPELVKGLVLAAVMKIGKQVDEGNFVSYDAMRIREGLWCRRYGWRRFLEMAEDWNKYMKDPLLQQ